MLALKQTIAKPLFERYNAGFRLGRLLNRNRALWIVTYHRVLPDSHPASLSEEPGMMVDPETFRAHLRLFREHFDLVRLSDWIANARRGDELPRSALAITFDDGWADNYHYALPALWEYRCPTTLFLVTDLLDSEREFWPNRIGRIATTAGLDPLRQHLSAKLTGKGALPASLKEPYQLIAWMKRFTDSQIESVLDEIEPQLGVDQPRDNGLLSWQQVRDMVASGYVDLGSHTRTHCRLLESLAEDTVFDEIVNSKSILEEQTGQKISLFCYPNGDRSELAVRMVDQHYSAGLTTERGVNFASDQLNYSCLRRFTLHQGVSDNDMRLLSTLARG